MTPPAASSPIEDERPRQPDSAGGSGQSGRDRASSNSQSTATAKKPDAAGVEPVTATGTTSRQRGSRNSYPQAASPKPGPVIENINEAGGPRQSTNMNLPAPGTMQKDIPLESSQADRDEKFAIGRLDTDHDSSDSAAAAKKRAIQFNPTRPSDPLRKPGREL